jgi:integrase
MAAVIRAYPRRDRRHARHHHPGTDRARHGQAADGGAARRAVRLGVQPRTVRNRARPAAGAALAWARRYSLPLTVLQDPRVTRGALDALPLRLDGTPAAANTISRKHAVFRNAFGYAVELGLLTASPLDRIAWNPPNASSTVDPRSAASPAQVRAILTEVTRIRPDLAAFFGCLYYAALRPEETVALCLDDCDLPARGWGQLTLTRSCPRSGRAWTGNGTSHEQHKPRSCPNPGIRPNYRSQTLRRVLKRYKAERWPEAPVRAQSGKSARCRAQRYQLPRLYGARSP